MVARVWLAGLLSAAAAAAAGAPADAAELGNRQFYVDNGVGIYRGPPSRYIAPNYSDTGLRPYLNRYHNRYDDVPPVLKLQPEVPVQRPVQRRPTFRAYEGSPALSGQHTDWCLETYKSYRASDDTFQPHHGERRKCNSPYG